MIPDTSRHVGLAYGACERPDDLLARRIAFLIDEEGQIVEAHPKVDPRSYPREQLERLP